MLSFIQIIAIIFSLFALSRVFLRAKDKKLSFFELLFWIGIWVSLIIVSTFPFLTSFFAKILGISRGTDLILYGSVGILFYLVFRLYIKLEETEREITKLVRENALEKNLHIGIWVPSSGEKQFSRKDVTFVFPSGNKTINMEVNGGSGMEDHNGIFREYEISLAIDL